MWQLCKNSVLDCCIFVWMNTHFFSTTILFHIWADKVTAVYQVWLHFTTPIVQSWSGTLRFLPFPQRNTSWGTVMRFMIRCKLQCVPGCGRRPQSSSSMGCNYTTSPMLAFVCGPGWWLCRKVMTLQVKELFKLSEKLCESSKSSKLLLHWRTFQIVLVIYNFGRNSRQSGPIFAMFNCCGIFNACNRPMGPPS